MFNPASQISMAVALFVRGSERRFLLFGSAPAIGAFSIQVPNAPRGMELWRNSIHIAIRFQIRRVLLRAASLASD